MGAGQGQGFRQMVNTLKLSEEQIADFSEIESAYRNQMHTYMQQLDSIDLSILEELKSETPNEEKLDSMAARAGNIQYHLKKTTADHFSAIKNLCTPSQKKRFNEVINDLNKFKRGQGQGRGQGFGRRGQGRGRNHFN
jgi:Spy/CpxP family protein refolding chaperone